MFLKMFEVNMKLKNASLFFFFFCCFCFHATASLKNKFETDDGILTYTNRIYCSNIKTAMLYPDGNPVGDPVMLLNGSIGLQFSFDDLDNDVKYYNYTLILCNADWTPSELSNFEYLNGYTDDRLTTYAFSTNTQQAYTHYSLELPGIVMKPTKSGNYLLVVYLDDVQHPCITKRFLVYESGASITAEVTRPDLVQYSDTHQQVDFNVNTTGLTVNNPFTEIHVSVLQNFRWDNAITNLQPKFVQNNLLDYNYQEENLFPAGKEFRHFECRSLRFMGYRVANIDDSKPLVELTLYPDEPRSYLKFYNETDADGKFVPLVQEWTDPQTQADYTWVNFFIPMSAPLAGGKVYLFGGFNDWNLTPENEMTYNDKTQGYECRILLKQGYYNYEFVFVDDKKPFTDESVLEGDWFEAENNYTVLVYYRPFGQRYDQLIGVRTANYYKQ
mgnify:CR=1 FL=1